MSGLGWSDIKEDLQASTKERLSGLQDLEILLQQANLGKTELGELLTLSPGLLADNNSKVALQTLEALKLVVQRADTPVAAHAQVLISSVADRLGDSRQPVRAEALNVLVSLFYVLRPELVLDKLSKLWQNKSWRVKHGLLEVIAEVASTSGAAFLGGRDQNNAVLKQIVCMMDEPEIIVREAAVSCLSELHRAAPAAVVSTIQASSLKESQKMEVLGRLGAYSMDTGATASDVGPRRPSGSYADDATGITADASQGFYAATDYSAPSGGRISGSGRAGASTPAGDAPLPRAGDGRRQQSSSSSGLSQAASAAAKRGGFKDGGGVTLDGELPAAAPVPISSERELREELEAATATLSLAPNTDWQARMAAMQRVEGLVLGGAVEYDCFHDAMKGLAQVLTQQFKERRSTIARQACHLIGVLSRAMGSRFEPHALTLLPTLFGVLVITVAVMAESADVGVRSMLRHCQTTRLLQAISDGVCKEKNPKTRQYCTSYLILILEEWDVSVWSRQVEAVEAAIRAAAQDSSADTRQSGRTAMALYNSALPDRAQAFLRRLDGGLQDKLSAALTGAKTAKPAPSTFSRQTLGAAMAAKRMARQAPEATDTDAGIVVMVPGASEPGRRPEQSQPAEACSVTAPRHRSASRSSSAFMAPAPSSLQQASSSSSTDVSDAPSRGLTGTLGRTARKSLALPPGRIPGGSADLTGLLGESSGSLLDSSTQARLRRPRPSMLPSEMPQRVPAPAPAGPPMTPAMRTEQPSAAARVPCAQTPDLPTSRPPVAPAALATSTSVRSSGSWQSGSGMGDRGALGSPGLVPLSRVMSAILSGPRTWNEKVDALSALDAHVRANTPGAASTSAVANASDDAAPSSTALLVAEPEKMAHALERVRDRLLEALDDPHQKVLTAALALLGNMVRHYGRVLEGQLDRLLPLLLNKGAEGKEQTRAQCADVIAVCGQVYRADVLVPALTKCMDLVKLPRSKQMALEFFRAHVGQWSSVNPTQLKHWLVRLAPLLDDRTPELRKRAGEVLDSLLALSWAREPINYVAYQHNNPDVGPLRRYLMSLPSGIPPVSAEASSSGGVGSALVVSGAPPPSTNDPRRQLPSAAAAAPVIAPQPLPSFTIHRHSGSGGNLGQAEEVAAQPTCAPPASQELSNAAAGPPSAQSAPRPYGAPFSPVRASVAAYGVRGGSLAPSPAKPGTPGPRLPGTPGSRRVLQVPPEPSAQAAMMSQLLDTAREALSAAAADPAGDGMASFALGRHTAAMESLADAVERCSRDAWVRTFPQLMVEFNSWVQHPTGAVRSMAFSLLRELLLHQPHLFTDNNLESQIGLLLHGCGDVSREVSTPANQTYSVLLSGCNAQLAMLLLQQLMPREREAHRRTQDHGSRLVAVMEGTRQLATRLSPEDLRRLTFTPHPETGSTLLEGLVANLADVETCVRRGAVVTLADLWYRLGHSVRDVLQVCARSSYNLLCIYYLKLHGIAMGTNGQSATEHPLVAGSAQASAML